MVWRTEGGREGRVFAGGSSGAAAEQGAVGQSCAASTSVWSKDVVPACSRGGTNWVGSGRGEHGHAATAAMGHAAAASASAVATAAATAASQTRWRCMLAGNGGWQQLGSYRGADQGRFRRPPQQRQLQPGARPRSTQALLLGRCGTRSTLPAVGRTPLAAEAAHGYMRRCCHRVSSACGVTEEHLSVGRGKGATRSVPPKPHRQAAGPPARGTRKSALWVVVRKCSRRGRLSYTRGGPEAHREQGRSAPCALVLQAAWALRPTLQFGDEPIAGAQMFMAGSHVAGCGAGRSAGKPLRGATLVCIWGGSALASSAGWHLALCMQPFS